MEEKRAKLVEKAIRLVWESLESHLTLTHAKIDAKTDGTHAFQKKCVKEYAELIKIIADLY